MKEGERPDSIKGNIETRTERWGYDARFKFYLYRLAILGNEGVEAITAFPERIELDDTWHTTLNRMREESRDGIEIGIPIGFRGDRRKVFLPQEFLLGAGKEERMATSQEAIDKFGISHPLGAIHSHPGSWIHRLAVKTLISTSLVQGFDGFSARDLYYMLDGYGLPMEVVVEMKHNFFAFRTRETRDIPVDSPFRSEVAFERHWYRKYGGYFPGKSDLTFITLPSYSTLKVNIGIAGAYNLALYKGDPGKDLVRSYPPI